MKRTHQDLSRRERQIMDIIHRQGEATAAEVNASLPDPPSYSAVRALLRILEEKGFLEHRQERLRYVYRPTESPDLASRSALRQVVETFFKGSLANAVAALVDEETLSKDELARIEAIVSKAKEEAAP